MTASQNSASTYSGSGWRRKTPILALVALLVGVWSVTPYGQSVMPVPKAAFYDGNGNPCAGCLLYAFAAGTNTEQNTYADVTLATPNENPVELDSAGRATVFLDSRLTYKFSLNTAADVPIWTVDAVDAVPSALNVDVTGIAGEPLAQRQAVYLSSGLDATVAGRWYLADADVVSKSSGASLVGIVMAPAIATLASGQIRIQGRVTGFVGLSEGLTYFVSATAGALTSTAPANVKVVGVAETTSTLLLTPSAASSGGVGAFSSLQVTSTAANSIDTAGGIEAGTGNVQVVDATGKIPAIDSTRFASLSGANLTGIPETAIADGALLARVAANETITGAWNLSNAATQAAAIQFTGIGAAAAGKIGLSANQLAFLGGSSGHGFFTSGGGLHTNVDAAGVWTFSVGNVRGIIVSRTSGDAGIQLTSVGGSGTAYGITSTTGGSLSIQHDADADPAIVLNGAANTLNLAATGGITLSGVLTPTRINSGSAQPGFLAARSIDTGSISSPGTLAFDAEIYDDAGNYVPGTGVFTAPVTGRYHFDVAIRVVNSAGGASTGNVQLFTTSRSYMLEDYSFAASETKTLGGSLTVNMTAGDTASIQFSGTATGAVVSGSSGVVERSFFSGRLVP